MAFEELKNYRDGRIWKRLLAARPEQAYWFYEYEPPDLMGMGFKPDIIYHYTDVNGLHGILQSGRLWASAAYYLNDSSEIEYGCQLGRRALGEWRIANDKNRCFAAETLRALDHVFSSPLSRISRSTTIYVACFCQNDNLLSQWRAYGQVGGYSLGFQIATGNLGLTVPGGFWDLRLAKVVYNSAVQQERINSFVKEALLSISESSLENVSEGARKALMRDAISYIENRLLDEIVMFKNPAFKEEKEWRLIVRPRLFDPPQNQESSSDGPIFKFRASRGFLIPYLELHPEITHLPLKSVRFGPSLDAARAENSVRMLLGTRGYDGVKVTGSEIPVIL
jgi:hypothetical protein